MKKLAFIALALAVGCNSTQKTAGTKTKGKLADPVSFASSITQDDLKTHLYKYASDEFQGRETGKPGQKLAIEYIKAHYQKLGIKAAKGNNDYFQDVPLEETSMPTGSMNINGVDYKLGEDFIAMAQATGSFNDLVYVGYGIADDNYSDYKNIDVKGKLVLAKTGEPMKADGTSVLTGTTEKSKWSNASEALRKRSKAATDNGAKGIIFYDDNNFARYKQYFDRMSKRGGGRIQPKGDNADAFSTIIIN